MPATTPPRTMFMAIDENDDGMASCCEFLAAVAELQMPPETSKTLSAFWAAVAGGRRARVGIRQRRGALNDPERMCRSVLPRAPARFHEQWRQVCKQVCSMVEYNLAAGQTWGYSEFVEHLYLHYGGEG
eukprot:gene28294-51460_t